MLSSVSKMVFQLPLTAFQQFHVCSTCPSTVTFLFNIRPSSWGWMNSFLTLKGFNGSGSVFQEQWCLEGIFLSMVQTFTLCLAHAALREAAWKAQWEALGRGTAADHMADGIYTENWEYEGGLYTFVVVLTIRIQWGVRNNLHSIAQKTICRSDSRLVSFTQIPETPPQMLYFYRLTRLYLIHEALQPVRIYLQCAILNEQGPDCSRGVSWGPKPRRNTHIHRDLHLDGFPCHPHAALPLREDP